jgi:hypothetical protein
LGPIFGDDKREIAVRLALQTTYGKHVPADCKVSGATAAAGSRKLYLKSYFVVDFQKIAGDARNDIIVRVFSISTVFNCNSIIGIFSIGYSILRCRKIRQLDAVVSRR